MAVSQISVETRYTLDFVTGALPKGAKRILEIGCGAGALTASLMAEGLEVVALDSDADAVALAQARGLEARLAAWPDFADGNYDAVLFTRSLHHVGDLGQSLDAAFSALRPGGRVIVEDFQAEALPSAAACGFEVLSDSSTRPA